MITLVVHRDRFDAASVEIAGDAYRHLFRSRRAAVGDTVRLVDGRGRARWSTVRDITRHRARLVPGSPAPSHEPRRRVVVLVAAPKPQRLAWMVEKLTEVGARAIHLWSTSRAPRRYGTANLDRLRRVAAAAVEQCERSRVPEIGVCSWQDGLERVRDFESRWLLVPGAPHPASVGAGEGDPLALLVGPEGGWTDEEAQLLEALPSRRVGLGPTILRVETAAVLGAALALAPAGARGPE